MSQSLSLSPFVTYVAGTIVLTVRLSSDSQQSDPLGSRDMDRSNISRPSS